MTEIVAAVRPNRCRIVHWQNNHWLRVGACEMMGMRGEMEDELSIVLRGRDSGDDSDGDIGGSIDDDAADDIGIVDNEASLLAVFDGHCGGEASVFLRHHLAPMVLEFADPHNPQTLCECMATLDRLFLERSCTSAGSTCCMAVMSQLTDDDGAGDDDYIGKLTIANVGDSRALLLRRAGMPDFRWSQECTRDHKPTDTKERQRIESAGGFVRNNRVAGNLSLSRAIGDARYKSNRRLNTQQQMVIATPDITQFRVRDGDVLLLACDGIFEQMTSLEVASFVHMAIAEQREQNRSASAAVAETAEATAVDMVAVCRSLVLRALQSGSYDNMTAMLCMFHRQQPPPPPPPPPPSATDTTAAMQLVTPPTKSKCGVQCQFEHDVDENVITDGRRYRHFKARFKTTTADPYNARQLPATSPIAAATAASPTSAATAASPIAAATAASPISATTKEAERVYEKPE
jgi:serine/threonine protein phosphatase PrpC